MKMNDNFLKRYNERQREEIHRVYNEIKWYVGESLQRDPCQSKEDLKIVNQRLSEVILNGFGHYLSTLKEQQEIRDRIINLHNQDVVPTGSNSMVILKHRVYENKTDRPTDRNS